MTDIKEQFSPDWVSPPGETITDILQECNMSKGEFAEKMGESIEFIDSLLIGQSIITDEIANKLENVLGSTSSFWLNRELQYRDKLMRYGR
jgi:HTH-type transcriptional regulator / antitoxin HigA